MYLLTGGSGVLGTELQKTYGMKFIAPNRDLLDVTWSAQEIMDELWSQNIEQNDVFCIIHTAAYTDVPGAEQNKKIAVETNVVGTKNMKDLANMFGARIVYISTDYVYDGIGGGHVETDLTRPVNFYALTKLAGESYIDGPDDLIIRTSFKPNTMWPYPSAFDDMYTSADYVDIIAPKIIDLIVHGESGMYNVGTERKSIYELARRRTTKVKPMSRKEIKDVHLPSDVSMNLDKFNNYYNAQYGCDAPDCCPKH